MKQLEHRNILPFYGISTTVADFCLVSPWYENGSIMDYLKKRPNTNRLGLVSVFEQPRYSRHLPVPANSYPVQPTDCASSTRGVWSTVT